MSSALAGGFFTTEPPGKPPALSYISVPAVTYFPSRVQDPLVLFILPVLLYLAGNRAQVQIWEMEEKSVDT